MQGSGGHPPGGGYPSPAGYPPPGPRPPAVYPQQGPPGQRIEVQVSYTARTIGALAIAIPLLLFAAYVLVSVLTYEPQTPNYGVAPREPSLIGPLAVALPALPFLLIPLTFVLERARIPRFIDATGVTMRNGAHFPWHTFQGVRATRTRTRSGTAFDTGVELVFATGTALLRYRPIVNKVEVFWIVDRLKEGRNPFG